MKKKQALEIAPEYNFKDGIRGKYAKKFAEGTNIILLAPDVLKDFPDSNSVNKTLRAISKKVNRNRKKIVA